MTDAREIARMLADRADQLVRDLLPGGRHDGNEWRVGSLAGERGSSLAVTLSGEHKGRWIDHNGGLDRGDMLDLVAAVRYGGNLREALTWARSWLGISNASGAPARPVSPAPAEAPSQSAAERSAAAQALWLAAVPTIARTPVDLYLRGRGIDLRELGRQPRALRFHPDLWCQEIRMKLPAMVAAVSSADGSHVATHRTWLARHDGQWRKARLEAPRKCLGVKQGGAIRLWRGSSGKPLHDAPAGDAVALAEGIETALSVAIACPELRVLAAIDVGNMAAIDLPPAITTVIVCAENDPPGSDAARAVARAVNRFIRDEGRDVRIARSPVGSDMNDLLRASNE